MLFFNLLVIFGYCLLSTQQIKLLLQSHGAQTDGLENKLLSRQTYYHICSLSILLFHGWILYKLIDTPFGQNLALVNLFSLTTWLIACLVYGASLILEARNLIILIYPVSAFSLLLACLWPAPHFVLTKNNLPLLGHILLSLMAMSLVGFAAIQALFIWFTDYLLRTKKSPDTLFKLPPLESMEAMLIHILLIGFLVFSLLLISTFWALPVDNALFPLEKMGFTVLNWGLISLLLIGHYRLGWRGMTVTKTTLLITFLLSIGYYFTHLPAR